MGAVSLRAEGYSPSEEPPVPHPNSIRWFSALAAFVLLAFTGCARWCPAGAERPQPAFREEARPDKGWWHVRFKIDWPPETEDPAWHMDVLLAHKVISPVLERHRQEICCWRFHRRAARDAGGHQFSFIFFCGRKTAAAVCEAVRSDALVQEMKGAGWITQDIYSDLTTVSQPRLEDTGDRRWSLPLQRSWPFFIMGVSDMWLALISEIIRSDRPAQEFTSLEETRDYYRAINERVEETWRKECGHALLHHLNALFGYGPLLVPGGASVQF